MKNKKGFTLIELLAVIVILAIIALIATPLVLKYIDKARTESMKISAKNYLDSFEKTMVSENLRNNKISDGTYKLSEFEVVIKGTKPILSESTIVIKEQKIIDCKLIYNDYMVTCNNGSSDLVISKLFVEIENFEFSPKEITIGLNKTHKININYIPNNTTEKDFNWSSSNSSIVTVENGVIKGIAAGEAIITAKIKDISKELKVKVEFLGKDEEGNYLITSAEDVILFRNQINSGNNDINVKLTGDIDLSSVCSSEKGNWVPIGNTTTPFLGIFDGNGKTISNLYINNSGSNYQGLFGLNKGTIKNVVVDGNVIGNLRTGCVVGDNQVISSTQLGVVENVANLCDVSGSSLVGGIAGHNVGIIKNSYNSGNITANYSLGGIVGGQYGTLVNAYNTGKITCTGYDPTYLQSYAGGVIGSTYQKYTYNIYNIGEVRSTHTYGRKSLGGAIGQANGGTSKYTYSLGNVYYINTLATNLIGNSDVGGKVIGFITNGPIYTNYAASIPNYETLNSNSSLLNYGDDVWVEDNANINNGYPIFSWQK